MEDIDEIVREFLVESHENLDQLDRDLVALEETPGARDLLSSVFRTIHTIKGTSGFLAFGNLERLTHVGENLLVELRDGKRSMDHATTDVLLRMVDTVRALLAVIERDGTEGGVDVDSAIAAIVAVQEGKTAEVPHPREVPAAEVAPQPPVAWASEPVAAPVAVPVAVPVVESPAEPEPAPAAPAVPEAKPKAKTPRAKIAKRTAPPVSATVETLAAAPPVPATPAPAPQAPAPQAPAPAPAAHVQEDADAALHAAAQQALATAAAAALEPVAEYVPVKELSTAPLEEVGQLRTAAESSIRVDVDLLDQLMRQVGELVLARNRLSRLAGAAQDADLARSAQQINLIATELQDGVMRTRMQPIEHVWSKMPRVVRDLASACGREVRLELTGGDTELDRGLLEAVKDPLTHLVRNAVDHGIESPADRVAKGKSSQGLLELRASHAGGQVVVEVRDDGAGIDPAKVAAKAVSKGLRTAEQVAAMSTGDLLNLLFLPGFSTAEAVTNVSGRGVGMDVVRTRVEAIGGTVDVESTIGVGTVWRLRIPLTLAILPALTVEVDGDVYAVPQVHVLELVALDSARSESAIEYVQTAPVYRLRGELLQLVSLAEVLGLGRGQALENADGVIVVVGADDNRFGLLVDRVLTTEEIVVTPLATQLKSIGIYSGTTVLGDGGVALILDIQAVARRTLLEVERGQSGSLLSAAQAAASDQVEAAQLLVAEIGDDRRVAMPLASVARLEHVRSDEVEMVGGREVIQYRGTILPLARLDRLLGARAEATDEMLLVVYTRGERSVGLVVEEIVDIVEDQVDHHSEIDDRGLIGSTVINGRVTELLDVRAAVLAADDQFYEDEIDEREVA
ncbi:chemotaxis protein CheA [Cellulomonas chitinilytica]|uniref:chemotaxis protein CheA n=1 Tax=Cellulomonas chitinilytica TaxID=398759 RepID=UPI001943E962|nr:chemotaxis protein CheA [Cellulomonas chitinilytica]